MHPDNFDRIINVSEITCHLLETAGFHHLPLLIDLCDLSGLMSELASAIHPHSVTLVAKLINEQESSKPIFPYKPRQTHKRQRSDTAQGQMHNGIVRPVVPAVAVGASQQKMRCRRNNNGEEKEPGP